jgi:ZIP family zinc transporter/zinc and cadmium transporter
MEIIYSLIAASVAMLGTLIVLMFHKWSKKNSFLIINFAAGIMLALAFTHLIPEGLELNPNPGVMVYVLLGFLIMFFLQFIVLFHPCHDEECSKHTGITSIVGLSLHSMIDGLVIAIGFEVNDSIGTLTTIAVLLHKLHDGITISGILLHKGSSKKKIFNFSLLAACFTPAGTTLGIFLFKGISTSTLGSLISLTAGSFIFLSASDLIPETHKCKNRFAPFMLFVGVIVILTVEYIMNK